MTYHISNDTKSRKCNAQSPATCPLRDNTQKFVNEIQASGGTIDQSIMNPKNHYKTAEEAQVVVESIMNARNPLRTKKKPPSAAFIKNRDLIKESLINFGNVSEEEISEVSNIREMVKEWFNGDRNAYNAFKYIAENETIDDETRKKIAEMVNGNFKVTTVQQVSNIGLKKNNRTEISQQSEITIIDEDSDKITLDDLRKGKIKPFI